MNKIKNNLGQGLVEVIIAVSVITTGIVGVITLTYSSLASSETSVKQIVAANLAREGLEVVHNIRDSNWLAHETNWRNNLASGTDYDGVVVFDPSLNLWTINFNYNLSSDFNYDDAADNPDLELYRTASGVYVPKFYDSSGSATGYTRFLEMKLICINKTNRNITIKSSGSNCPSGFEDFGIKVISTVKWLEKTGPKIFTAEEDIYNWLYVY